MKPGNIVLVHEALKPISQAALTILHHHGCHVFATVHNEQQAISIQSKFYFIDKRNCFYLSDFYQMLLTNTAGYGADIILNASNDNTVIELSFKSLAFYGKLLQFSSNKLSFQPFIGMQNFLNNTFILPVSTQALFRLDVNVKRKLHKLVEEGIKDFIVKPLERHLISDLKSEPSLRYVQ